MTTIQQFDYNVNLLRALLWEYNEAVNLQGLLEQKEAWYDVNQQAFWQDWYDNVFNLKTANDFGLQVWFIILGAPIYINKGPVEVESWGFEEFHENFSHGNFGTQYGSSFRLPTETARVLLRLRYYQLTGSGTVPEINRLLADVFEGYAGEGISPAYLLDKHDMTQLYIFRFAPSSSLTFLFDNFDILPRPAGVGSEYRVIVEESWGFGEFHENFDNGNFSEL